MSFNDSVINVIKKYIQKEMPHCMESAIYIAKIISKKEDGSFYIYSVSILDQNNNIDKNYPVIPDVKNKMNIELNSYVALGNVLGANNLVILQEVIL